MRSQTKSTRTSFLLSSSKWLMLISFLTGCTVTSIIQTFFLFHDDVLELTGKVSPMQQLASKSFLSDQKAIKSSILDGVRILVTITSYDFAQTPHLEEVLDGYQSLCASGAYVNIVIYTTIPYTVALIDMLNTRMKCLNPSPRAGMNVKISIRDKALRLHLVDLHRTLFYDKIEEFDLFIYSEDDILVTPANVAAYLYETKRIENIVGKSAAEDFNVGIVRYEYNYPPGVVIEDKTRLATANATRVYWEHSVHPFIPNSMDAVPQSLLSDNYVHMTNHHQGMYLATQDLLKAWKKRENCRFNEVRERPGMKNNPSQPSEGTQRVWMSSQMLYGHTHCNVQQVLPMDNFGQLSLLHLPNKNYRRVGQKGRIGGTDKGGTPDYELGMGEDKFQAASSLLPTAIQVHLEMRKNFPRRVKPGEKYNGIIMENDVGGSYRGNKKRLANRINAYKKYVERGGILSETDFEHWDWLEDDKEFYNT